MFGCVCAVSVSHFILFRLAGSCYRWFNNLSNRIVVFYGLKVFETKIEHVLFTSLNRFVVSKTINKGVNIMQPETEGAIVLFLT